MIPKADRIPLFYRDGPLEDVTQAGPGMEQAVTDAVSLTCALAALPPDLREAFLLVKAEGLTHREAAQVLGIPQGTVQWRVHHAARRLRTLLTEEGNEEGD